MKYREDEWDAMGEWNAIVARKRVICMSILKKARTPDAIKAVAEELGEPEYSTDEIVLEALSNYWAE